MVFGALARGKSDAFDDNLSTLTYNELDTIDADGKRFETIQIVTLTVGDDLSGEIAQYTEGAVTDDQGNVVAGESVVAADAEGDVVAAADVAAGTVDDADEAASS